MGRLTEAAYHSRRIKLTANIEAAESAYAQAALMRELDEADDATVSKALDDVSTLKGRLLGLTAAWNATLERGAAEYEERQATIRRDAVAKADALLASRIELGREMEGAIAKLADAYHAYLRVGVEAMKTVLPVAKFMGGDTGTDIEHLRNQIAGSMARPTAAIAGMLMNAGVDLSTVSWRPAGLAATDEAVTEHIAGWDAGARQRIALITADLDDEE